MQPADFGCARSRYVQHIFRPCDVIAGRGPTLPPLNARSDAALRSNTPEAVELDPSNGRIPASPHLRGRGAALSREHPHGIGGKSSPPNSSEAVVRVLCGLPSAGPFPRSLASGSIDVNGTSAPKTAGSGCCRVRCCGYVSTVLAGRSYLLT